MNRRTFVKINSGMLLALPFNTSYAPFSAPPIMDYQTHPFRIGKFSCRIFKDMMFRYLGKDYFINASVEEAQQELSRYKQTWDNIPSPFIAMLVEHGQEKILIDTGIGFTKEPIVFRGTSHTFQGRLAEVLRQEKVDAADITRVILTHFHPDHIGGVVDEAGNLNFPNATFYMHEQEWNYWFSSGSDNQPPMFRLFIDKHIGGLKKQPIELIKGKGQEILPGIHAIHTPGHTPGQIALRISSEQDKVLYISDAFLHPLHIEHLDWKTSYDQDHELAKASRKQLLEMAFEETMQINAFHFDFPGLGYAAKTGTSWQWIYNR